MAETKYVRGFIVNRRSFTGTKTAPLEKQQASESKHESSRLRSPVLQPQCTRQYSLKGEQGIRQNFSNTKNIKRGILVTLKKYLIFKEKQVGVNETIN